MTAAAATSSLDSSVLVLNKLYVAVHIVSVRRAFTLLCKEIAEVVSIEEGQWNSYDFESWRDVSELRRHFKEPHEDWLRTVSFEIQVPRIIRLLQYDRLPKQSVKFNRRNIFARDGNRCQYCGKRFSTTELTLDHVVPRAQGGKATWNNIVCACMDCNVKKGGRTPVQANMKLVREPVKPKTSPMVSIKLGNQKYQSWKTFLDNAYWSVELK
ncbi:MAG: HNH endonuclease [Planctomycetota bacterium]